MDVIVLGDGALGRAIASALEARGDRALIRGRPPAGGHDPASFEGVTAAVDATAGPAVAGNVAAALAGGVRRIVIATTAWEADRPRVEAALVAAGAAAVAGPNLAIGMALFARVVAAAAAAFRFAPGFEPYLVEWHRRAKTDRPSGTARALAGLIADLDPARRPVEQPLGRSAAETIEVVGVRAGANPGSHLVGFDGPGETIELRHVAHDRSAYATGALAALDWLAASQRAAGLHDVAAVIDTLLAGSVPQADAAIPYSVRTH